EAGAGAAVGASAPSETPEHRDGTQRLPGMAPMWQMSNGSWPVHTLGPQIVGADADPAPQSTAAPIGPEPPVGAAPPADDPVLAPDAPDGGQR
nr:hypothetical protein [Actinomycetota bacterium]